MSLGLQQGTTLSGLAKEREGGQMWACGGRGRGCGLRPGGKGLQAVVFVSLHGPNTQGTEMLGTWFRVRV